MQLRAIFFMWLLHSFFSIYGMSDNLLWLQNTCALTGKPFMCLFQEYAGSGCDYDIAVARAKPQEDCSDYFIYDGYSFIAHYQVKFPEELSLLSAGRSIAGPITLPNEDREIQGVRYGRVNHRQPYEIQRIDADPESSVAWQIFSPGMEVLLNHVKYAFISQCAEKEEILPLHEVIARQTINQAAADIACIRWPSLIKSFGVKVNPRPYYLKVTESRYFKPRLDAMFGMAHTALEEKLYPEALCWLTRASSLLEESPHENLKKEYFPRIEKMRACIGAVAAGPDPMLIKKIYQGGMKLLESEEH